MADEIEAQKSLDARAVWKMICDLHASEKHFNEIKAKCRALASTWLLAAFGAMGFLAKESLSINLPVEVMIFGIGLAAATGVLLLWVLDLLVYHRLLDAYFSEAKRLEEEHPDLPQVRQKMVASMPGGQVTYYQAWFYIGTINAPLIFSGALFVYWCRRFGLRASVLASIAVVVMILLLGLFVWLKSPNPALRNKLSK